MIAHRKYDNVTLTSTRPELTGDMLQRQGVVRRRWDAFPSRRKMASDKDAELAKFHRTVERDKARFIEEPALLSWLFADRLHARNERLDMNFYGFDGDEHLRKFFQWQKKLEIADYLPADLVGPLVEASLARDRNCLSNLELGVPERIVVSLAHYNAQDYAFQRAYPVPEAQQPRVILDFGAGFGRMANLAFGAPGNTTRLLVAVDAIAGPYLTQRVYYRGLGLDFADYIDFESSFDFEQHATAVPLIHLPTWRLDLVPASSIDMICCVQVLKEIPGEVLLFVLEQFGRILKPRGALYVRDHLQYHHPNQMPINELLRSSGFEIEFQPMLRDRKEIHGLPRIWRKLDARIYLDTGVRPKGQLPA